MSASVGKMQIRPATPADAGLLVDVIRSAFRDVAQRFSLTPENCPTHPSLYTLERIGNDFGRGIAYYLAEESGRALGCVALERANPSTFYLERLAVVPEARGRGIGKALVRHALRLAAEGGAETVSIAIIAAQDELRRWYEGLGFRYVETKSYKHLPFEVAFMRFELEEAPKA